MRFCTEQECEDWLRARDRLKPDALWGAHKERVRYPPEHYRIFFVAHWIATSLTYRKPALLWITEWGIWPSSENHHLYYRLRQSYGDNRLLQEAPGHLFLEHETETWRPSFNSQCSTGGRLGLDRRRLRELQSL